MPIVTVELTDTLDQWRQKTNAMIAQINTLSASGTVLSISNPLAGQMLVFDGTFFRNMTLTGDVTINSSGHTSVSGGVIGGLTKGRVRFAGSIKGLY